MTARPAARIHEYLASTVTVTVTVAVTVIMIGVPVVYACHMTTDASVDSEAPPMIHWHLPLQA